jgi:hypothetical protein
LKKRAFSLIIALRFQVYGSGGVLGDNEKTGFTKIRVRRVIFLPISGNQEGIYLKID